MCLALSCLALLPGMAGLSGCEGPPRLPLIERPPPVLRITHHVGGRHERMLIHGGLWYQTFGRELLVLEPSEGSIISGVPLRAIGESGAVTDMVIHGEALFAVLEDDGIAELSLADPRRPVVVRFTSAERLGIRPRCLSVADGEVYASGAGGVVRLADGEVVYAAADSAGRIVTSNWGPVTTVGRRIYRLRDGEYIGSASALLPLPVGSALPGAFAFIRHGDEGASVGLMHSDLREVDAQKATVHLDAPVHRVRVLDDRVWVVTEEEIRGYVLRDDELRPAFVIPVGGARDVDALDEGHLAIAGTFGRGIWRLWEDEHGPGASWASLHREPGGLTWAEFDGRQVLAGGGGVAWLYTAESGVQPSGEDDRPATRPALRATAIGAAAHIAEDGRRAVLSTPEGRAIYDEPDEVKLYCIVAVDGRFWLGHQRGITVLRGRDPEPTAVMGRLRLDGPVRFIFPLLGGGGAVYVSEFGGLGVARFEEPRSR